MSRAEIERLLAGAPPAAPCDRAALMVGLRDLALPAAAAATAGALCERPDDDPYHRFACVVRDQMRAGDDSHCGDWPDADGSDPDLAAAYLLAFAAALDAMELRCSAAGFSNAAITALKQDIAWWCSAYERRHGHWGLREVSWAKRHMTAGLLPVGRLQYEATTWHPACVVCRHRDGQYLVLAGDALGIGADDHLAHDHEIVRRSLCSEQADGWSGHVCRRDGSISTTPLTLPADSWQAVLKPGDPVITLHIPASGPMDAPAIDDSFAAAPAAIAAVWPALAQAPLVCDSWLLDRQLQASLKPGANISAFQERFLTCPDGPSRNDNLRFAFDLDRSPDDWRTLTPQGSLQCGIIDHLAAGGVWRGGRGVRPWPWSDEPIQVEAPQA